MIDIELYPFILVVLLSIVLVIFLYFLSNREKNEYTLNEKLDDSKDESQLNVETPPAETIVLKPEQKKVFDLLENTSKNYYVTGKAGTGKSVLLEYFSENTRKQVAVVAPTGVAALNVGGQTIHSFFKIKPDLIQKGEISRIDYKTKEVLANLDAIVIDEISMVRVDLIEAISEKLKLARRNDEPFGGIQMIMFGDLYQLPPVVSDGQLQRYFDHNYGGVYFFKSPSLEESGLSILELNTILRQKDEDFKYILNSIRQGKIKQTVLSDLNKRAVVQKPNGGFVTLAGNNRTVSYINHKNLAELAGEEKNYEAEIWGDIKQSAFPTEKDLKLKVGAQVMILKNDTQKPQRWVNGTLGVVTKLKDDCVRIKVNGVEHTILPDSWDKIVYEYDHIERKVKKKVVSSFQQLPLRLAWAITIHKSQGQTYKSVAIDLSEGAFAHGQTYVALSRCVSLDGLYLEAPIRREDIIVDPDVVEFMKEANILTA